MKINTKDIAEKLKKNKYVLVVLLVGAVLILWPSIGSSGGSTADADTVTTDAPVFSLEDEEDKIAKALSEIEGAGRVSVVLTLKTGTEQELATDEDTSYKQSTEGGEVSEYEMESSTSTVIVSTGSGTQSTVTVKYIYPEYRGALIVSEGAGNPTIKLQITEAVAALTGLKTDKITVVKMKSG